MMKLIHFRTSDIHEQMNSRNMSGSWKRIKSVRFRQTCISVELGQATGAESVSISAVIATFSFRSVKLRSRVLLTNQLGAGSGESKHLFLLETATYKSGRRKEGKIGKGMVLSRILLKKFHEWLGSFRILAEILERGLNSILPNVPSA